MHVTGDAFDRLLAAHGAMGSPIPGYLRPPADAASIGEVETRLGHRLPAEVAELYGLADGTDWGRWGVDHPGRAASLLPGLEFLSLQHAAERSAELRVAAGSEGAALWRDDWLVIFTNLTTGDAHVVVATGDDPGTLWSVQWEVEPPRRLPWTLPGLLDAGIERFRALEARWDTSLDLLVWDDDREDELGGFP